MFDRLTACRPQALSILRIVTAFLFAQHGLQKILGLLGGHMGKGHPAELASLSGLSGILELGGGLLLLLGLFTQPVAFLLSGEMAVAYFLRHAERGFWPILNGGELAAFYSFVFLCFSAAGGGAWSVDSCLRKK